MHGMLLLTLLHRQLAKVPYGEVRATFSQMLRANYSHNIVRLMLGHNACHMGFLQYAYIGHRDYNGMTRALSKRSSLQLIGYIDLR